MSSVQQEPVAIVGIGCRFPGAANPQAFWELLQTGRSAIREVPAQRWQMDNLYDPDPSQPGKMVSRWGGFLDHVDHFDWRTFRILPREARAMDPQHRLLLEVAWEAFEDSGLPLTEVAGSRTGVFMGIGWSDYLRLQSRNWSKIDAYTAMGSASCFAANRLSYVFGLNGPSVSLDAGCTSSLMSIYLACQSLWLGDATLALAGGVNLMLSPDSTIMVSKAGLLAPDGRCKTLDADADGFVRGEGAGIVVLKLLSQVRPEDRVYALIQGVAVNHNGHNEWIIASSQSAQEALLREAYHKAGVDPVDVSYVELHGTGFKRGDPIEVKALGSVLNDGTRRTHPCMIGAVKTNIGHLEAAAGIASVIKVALALHHREIPPTLNLQTLNPEIPFQELHFAAPRTLCAWPEKDGNLFAGVTTLAFTGANAHAVLTTPPLPVPQSSFEKDAKLLRLLPLSARSKEALYAQVAAFKDFLQAQETVDNVSWRDICYTASVRRTHHKYCLTVQGHSAQEAALALAALLQKPHAFEEALYTEDCVVDWSALYPEKCQCVSIPTYQWQRESLWLDWLDVASISVAPEDRHTASPLHGIIQPEQDMHEKPVVEVLQALCCDLLGFECVSLHDNFFELGGHSLLAAQLIAQIRTIFRVEISLRDMFAFPTISGIAELVSQRLASGQNLQTAALLPLARTQHLPLSFAQQRLWFLNQLEPESTAYNVPIVIKLRGRLDISALKRSLAEIVRRHESIRTNFNTVEGQAVQIISAFREISLPVIDLSRLDAAQQEMAARQLAQREACYYFDLARDLLIRTALVTLEQEHHLLLCTMHHINFDGWSLGVFMRELTLHYNAFVEQRPVVLADLPVQYADFAAWQRTWMQGELLTSQLAYWTRQLAELMPLELPTDHSRPAKQTFHGAQQECLLPAQLRDALQALSQRENVTLFMTLLAAFQVLLLRYSGQSDIAVGAPVANRMRPEITELIGCFINTLVLRTNLAGNPTFQDVLVRVREVALEAYAHQDVPFEKLVEVLQPERDLSRSPLFQVMFVLQPTTQEIEPLRDLVYDPVIIESTTAKFDLVLAVTRTGQGLHCAIEYNTDLFASDTIARLAGHWQTLLESIVAHPEQNICALPLLSAMERQQLLVAWNPPIDEEPADLCMHTLVELQVAAAPESVALVFQDEQITYAELNRRANQLAHYLRRLGVGPDVLVSVCMERSLELVIGILAILKAGGAYVPLDPTHPRERLALIIKDTQMQFALTQRHLKERLPTDEISILCLDADWASVETMPEDNLAIALPGSLMYVIYTSGSTGVPKGVLVDHRNVTRLFTTTRPQFHFDNHDVWTLFHSYTFDFSVWELWGALLYGGRLVVVPYMLSRMPEVFYGLLAEQGVTVLNQTPSAFMHLIQAEENRSQTLELALRYVIFGGEALEPRRLQSWAARHKQLQLINMYGITETTVHVTYHCLTQADLQGSRGSFIGFPLADLQVYILDEYQHLVPIGVAGEMYVGGAGLAWGYLKRPALTSERFVVHPFSHVPGARLYRTGDLARRLANGGIEYLGRIDHQVKIRGYRIELGEIEAVLEQHSALQTCVVIVREDITGDKRLVAYVVPVEGTVNIAGADLRQYLQGKLPDYMVPAFFVVLDALPLTSNGKVDRRVLPVPALDEPRQDGYGLEIRGPIEDIVAQIYTEVLGRKHVSRSDNFFEIGGHSLLATQLISRLRLVLQREIPLRCLFEFPTVAGLALQIERTAHDEQAITLPPLLPVPHMQGVALSFAQQRLWFQEQLQPGNVAYNLPQAIHLQGILNVAALEASLDAVIRRHESLRTTFQIRDNQPLQMISPSGVFYLPLIDVSILPSEERETAARQLTRQEAFSPFDLSRGPLLRTWLVRLSNNEHVLLLTMHHIISDGWSLSVLLNEMINYYNAFATTETLQIPALPVQYADFAIWQRQCLQGPVLEELLNYWTRQLGNLSALELPTDHPRPAIQSNNGKLHFFVLPEELTTALKEMSQKEGVTFFMTLLTAFQILLYRYTHQSDIAVGTDIANRTRVEIENLIGFFVNLLVLRSDLSGSPGFRKVLGRVQQMVLGAYAHQDMPFDMLVERLQPRHSLDRMPLIQVLFVLQNVPPVQAELRGVTLKVAEYEAVTAKFDLALFLQEDAEGLHGIVNYSTALFEEETISTMMGRFEVLLRSILSLPDAPIDLLEIYTEEEKARKEHKKKSSLNAHLSRLKSSKRR